MLPKILYNSFDTYTNKELLFLINSLEDSFDFKNSYLLRELVICGRYELVKHFLENGYDIHYKHNNATLKTSTYIFINFHNSGIYNNSHYFHDNLNIINDITLFNKFVNLFKSYGEDFSYFNDEKFYRYIIDKITHPRKNKKTKTLVKDYHIINLIYNSINNNTIKNIINYYNNQHGRLGRKFNDILNRPYIDTNLLNIKTRNINQNIKKAIILKQELTTLNI